MLKPVGHDTQCQGFCLCNGLVVGISTTAMGAGGQGGVLPRAGCYPCLSSVVRDRD